MKNISCLINVRKVNDVKESLLNSEICNTNICLAPNLAMLSKK